MNKNLRWRVLTIVTVIALAVWAFYPPSQKVNLGLDLKGGVHLVMRVQTDAALRIETETTVERLRESLTRASVQSSKLEVVSPTEFVAEGIQNDQGFRQAATDVDTVFGRSPGAGRYTYTMRPIVANQLREEAVMQALQTIERRVNELGVVEPIVSRYGAGNQILVQLPGVTDVTRAKEIIRSTALLELKIVEQGPFPTKEAAMQAVNNTVPAGQELVPGSQDVAATGGGTPSTVYYFVRRVAPITGRDLRNARSTLDENNLPAVSFSLNQDGARRFGQLTEQNINRQLAIILDSRIVSAPVIQSRITDEGRISAGGLKGVFLKWLIDEKLGARHHRLLFIEYQPGVGIGLHDHGYEEAYFILSGEIEATLDGERYLARPGDVVWTGVGCVHAFVNTSSKPVRWLETFSPQPPTENVFRFMAEWDKRAKELEG